MAQNSTQPKYERGNHHDETIEVTAVIPCLNEEETIGICINKALSTMVAAGINGEVVVSDNGSTDKSVEIAKEIGARVVQQPLKGYGYALRKGFMEARGKYIVMADADDSYDWNEIPRFVAKLREGYEFVMGTRLKGEIRPGAMPWLHRYIGNPVLSWIVRFLFGSIISDAHCGLRAFTREAVQRMDLRTGGMELASEIVIKAAMLKMKTTELPITLHPDARSGLPHLRTFRDGWRHLRFMLLYSPDYLFLWPGFISFLLGVVIFALVMPKPLWISQVRFDTHSLILGMVMIILGIQIIALGLFAKVFSYSEKFGVLDTLLVRMGKKLSLEVGLIIGFLVALVGFCCDLVVFINWSKGGYGPLHEMRLAIFGSTFLIVGVQIMFSSTFLSMLGVNRETFIGD